MKKNNVKLLTLILLLFGFFIGSERLANYEGIHAEETEQERNTEEVRPNEIPKLDKNRVNQTEAEINSTNIKLKKKTIDTTTNTTQGIQDEGDLSRSISEDSLEPGFEIGSIEDSIIQKDNQISWNFENNSWNYSFKGREWSNPNSSSNDMEIFTTKNDILYFGSGFLQRPFDEEATTFSINKTTKTLKRSILYKVSSRDFKIDIYLHLLEDGGVEVEYRVTNLSKMSNLIGIEQITELDHSVTSTTVLNGFKGIRQVFNESSVVILPDPLTMPNWAMGSDATMLTSLTPYKEQNQDGVGWETGKRYRDPWSGEAFPEPIELMPNQPIQDEYGNLFGFSMKKSPVDVAPNASISFKQKIIFSSFKASKLTVDQTKATMYQDDTFEITGSLLDNEHTNSNLYLELDDEKKTKIVLKEFKDNPIGTKHTFKANIKGKHFTAGRHVASIVAVNDYGSESNIKKINFTINEVNGTPIIQAIPVGGQLPTTINELFSELKGTGVKLKESVKLDSGKVGFQWAAATLIDKNEKENIVKIPVTIYNSRTTAYDKENKIAIDVQPKTITTVEFDKNKLPLDEFIFEKLAPKAWNMADGREIDVTILNYQSIDNKKSYSADFKAKQLVDEVEVEINKTSHLFVRDTIDDGYEGALVEDNISKGDYKIGWDAGMWMYTYKEESWLYNNNTLNAELILNGKFPEGRSDATSGFLTEDASSTYSVNWKTNSLKHTRNYLKDYKIEITQTLLENNAVEVTYKVINVSKKNQKIGVSQYADVFVGSDSVPIAPINDFKGINLFYDSQKSLVIFPDSKSYPNWVAGNISALTDFGSYETKDSSGLGWETGKQYRDDFSELIGDYDDEGNFIPKPNKLKENELVNLGDSGVAMKNQGVDVQSGDSTSFKETLKFGKMAGPTVTLDQTEGSIYQDEKLPITGSISDIDSNDYRLYLELDDANKSLVLLKEYKGIPFKEKQLYQAEIDGKDLKPGKHTFSVIGIDETGVRSEAKKITVTVTELNGTPAIQKVKIGEEISTDLNVLFEEIRGTDVKIKNPPILDSSKAGFQWVETTLIDAKNHESIFKIPVNVYDPEITVFNDKDKIALSGKDSVFSLAEVQTAMDQGLLNELVLGKVAAKSWNMEDGTENKVEVIENQIEPIFGDYTAKLKAVRGDTKKTIEKTINLAVGGALEFKTVPDKLSFESKKLGDKVPYAERKIEDWKIEIENTLSTNWTLNASTTAFKGSTGKDMKDTLVYRDSDNQELILNGNSQKIVSGDGQEQYPVIQWKKTEGLLLKINPAVQVGKYKGTINWSLTDAPS